MALPILHGVSLPPIPSFELPPLPPILDKNIREEVFTHTSYYSKPKGDDGMFEERNSGDNEKLEHVGDAMLGFAVTGLLHDLYPNLNPGNATLLKSHLVSNSTLAQLSRRYDLPSKLLAGKASLYTLQVGSRTSACLFEAYLAGVFYSYLKNGPPSDAHDGISTPPRSPAEISALSIDGSEPKPSATYTRGQAQDYLEAWLRPLFTPLAIWVLDYLKAERLKLTSPDGEAGGGEDGQDLDKKATGALAILNQWFTQYGAGVPKFDPEPAARGWWTMRCVALDKEGKAWNGEATRSTKQAAKSVAAYKICVEKGIITPKDD